jgi:hypothetical protein
MYHQYWETLVCEYVLPTWLAHGSGRVVCAAGSPWPPSPSLLCQQTIEEVGQHPLTRLTCYTHTHTQRNVLLFKIIKQEKNRPGQRGKITYIWIQTKNRWGNRESRLRMDLFTDVVHICVIECAHMVAFPTWLRHGVSHVSRCRSVTGPWRAAGGSCRRVLRTRLHWIDILFYFI